MLSIHNYSQLIEASTKQCGLSRGDLSFLLKAGK